MSLSGARSTTAPATKAGNSTVSKGGLGASTAGFSRPYILTLDGGGERVWTLTPNWDYLCPISFVYCTEEKEILGVHEGVW